MVAGMRWRLSYHRRYNWPIGRWRNNKVRVVVWLVTALLSSLILLGVEFSFERSSRIEAESSHKALIADILKHDQPLGTPGTTWTDWKEGTAKWKR